MIRLILDDSVEESVIQLSKLRLNVPRRKEYKYFNLPIVAVASDVSTLAGLSKCDIEVWFPNALRMNLDALRLDALQMA